MLAPDVQPQVPAKVQVFNLERESELRIEIDDRLCLSRSVTVLQGTAEVFGTELAVERKYHLSGVNFAVFTWHGCALRVEGQCHSYVAGETPMVTYLNTHAMIEDRRLQASSRNVPGPRVMIVGPGDTGKSTLARILLNYAVRRSHHPILVDLDVGQNQITIPGTIAALPMDRPVDIEQMYTHEIPLVYFYGHASPGENPKLYRMMVSNLADQLARRMAFQRTEADSGLIINSCGWVDGAGYELLLHAISAFQADIVLCIDNERLYADLTQYFSANRNMRILKIAKSGGVVSRQPIYRKKTRMTKIKSYFYGPTGADLSPHSTVVDFKDVSLYRIGGQITAPLSALPIGASSTQDPTQLSEVAPSADMAHSVSALALFLFFLSRRLASSPFRCLFDSQWIFAVSHATSPDRILDSNAAGFLYVQKIDFENQKITFLSPCPGALPSRYVVVSGIKWLE